ncbi:HAD-IIB family hydrolase [Bacillus infantis]|uniref:HAD-IIB family hydrolase n=1 Tax=Bacillus infantis TaxID=324767 RepID=A0A5D4SAC6_9BACI|nr:HAD-IIB family hydrolase [Bacillus infantis]TYS60553.1 HAD-IIB family hydrolase [Bacillus infantis]
MRKIINEKIIENIKAIAFDFDGTIYNETTFMPNMLATLNSLHDKGYKLYIVTGRNLRSFIQLNLPQNILELFNCVICNDGNTCIYPSTGVINIFAKLEVNDFKEVYRNNKAFADFVIEENCHLYADNEISRTKYSKYSNIKSEYIKVTDISSQEFNSITQIFVFPKQEVDIKTLYTIKYNNALKFDYKGEFIKIIPKETSKAKGLEKVIRNENLSLDKVLAFGDHVTDIPLLSECLLGVAVKNCHQDIINYSNLHLDIEISDFLKIFLNKISQKREYFL